MLNLITKFVTAESLFDFRPQRFVEMLTHMGKGMLVIFVIIGVLVLSVLVLNALTKKKNK